MAREGDKVAFFFFHPHARLELARLLINYHIVHPINLNHKVFSQGFSD